MAINRQDLLAKAIEFMRLKEGREIAQTAMLQGATSAIHVDIDDDDVVSRRVDLLVSASSNGKGLAPAKSPIPLYNTQYTSFLYWILSVRPLKMQPRLLCNRHYLNGFAHPCDTLCLSRHSQEG